MNDSHVADKAGMGLTMGAAFGLVVGAALGNAGLGLIFGALVGLVMGPAIGAQAAAEPPPEPSHDREA